MARATASREASGSAETVPRHKPLETFLLKPLGLELDLLDALAKALGRRGLDELRRLAQAAADSAERHDDGPVPALDRGDHAARILRIDLAAALGRPEQEEQNIDVDAEAVLQREAGLRDGRIKPQRETPER